jgi:quercetin dioxygenase-like cupin family protein
MEIKNMYELPYMTFPTGRNTRVMIGQNGAVKGRHFCQGFVDIFEGGSIPEHKHETVETYTILEGCGLFTIDGESYEMKKGDYVFIDSNQTHSLLNTGKTNLHMMFVYAPQIVVDHWAEELQEKKESI